ncbi:DUF1616 domain-containing protein [Halobaculum sp. MBLA0143]|uniref:DUF1616 domain-containing protein n=1 Tax=Halobaculum sp. MBLA0143 TaxID=3079933 RepID=UPI003524D042
MKGSVSGELWRGIQVIVLVSVLITTTVTAGYAATTSSGTGQFTEVALVDDPTQYNQSLSAGDRTTVRVRVSNERGTETAYDVSALAQTVETSGSEPLIASTRRVARQNTSVTAGDDRIVEFTLAPPAPDETTRYVIVVEPPTSPRVTVHFWVN